MKPLLVNLLVVHEGVPLLARAVTAMGPEAQKAQRAWRLAKAAEHYAAGDRLRLRGQAGEAIAQFSAAATLAPSHASYCVALAGALEADGHPAAAAEALARAGALLVAKGKYERAVPELTRALAWDRLNPTARTQLVLAYRHLSRDQQVEATAVGGHRRAGGFDWAGSARHEQSIVSASAVGHLRVLSIPLFIRPYWLAHAGGGRSMPGGTDLILRDVLGGGAYLLRNANLLVILSLVADSLDYLHATVVKLPVPSLRAPNLLVRGLR